MDDGSETKVEREPAPPNLFRCLGQAVWSETILTTIPSDLLALIHSYYQRFEGTPPSTLTCRNFPHVIRVLVQPSS